jgi:uncharacterized protein
MNPPVPSAFVVFEGSQCLARGSLAQVALQYKAAVDARPFARFMVFNASTSEIIDLDHRGTPEEVLARLPASVGTQPEGLDPQDPLGTEASKPLAPAGPGRPKLGVVAREVTLLPRHWAWLASQPGGASVAMRKLVEQARRDGQTQDKRRQSQEASYRFMSAMAGSLEGFEEAARALFAADPVRFATLISSWPADIQMHLLQLAQVALTPLDQQPELESPRV